ncbi:hypothetical protein BC834DRAFT_974524 [Gloeopeniophorella convolvens]|nr:hypothetical protein BC834DRAFT_974524 [Gloeopeniophorella convolvens]
MARDLKVNIRKRVIASFFEWDHLDQASGGRAEPLGTRVHQQTRKGIEKRAPALKEAIKKFNKYCIALKEASDPYLFEDVWVEPLTDSPPRWLVDKGIQKGIHAVLRFDRASEEKLRLEQEMSNLVAWFGCELAAIQVALLDPRNESLRHYLSRRLHFYLLLRQRWQTPLVTDVDFDTEVTTAADQLRQVSGVSTSNCEASSTNGLRGASQGVQPGDGLQWPEDYAELGSPPLYVEPDEPMVVLDDLLDYNEPIEPCFPFDYAAYSPQEEVVHSTSSTPLTHAPVNDRVTTSSPIAPISSPQACSSVAGVGMTDSSHSQREQAGADSPQRIVVEFITDLPAAIRYDNLKDLRDKIRLWEKQEPGDGNRSRIRSTFVPADITRLQSPNSWLNDIFAPSSLHGSWNLLSDLTQATHPASKRCGDTFIEPSSGFKKTGFSPFITETIGS